MLILPQKWITSEPRIKFYFKIGRIVITKDAAAKANLSVIKRVAFDLEDGKLNIVYHKDGYKVTPNRQAFHINSELVCKMIQEKFATEKDSSISFLVGHEENGVVECIISSKISKTDRIKLSLNN